MDRTSLERALSDRYRILREAGRGGMAVVYLAEDLKHDRQVALKVLEPEAGRELAAERFHREIRVAAGLQHPHVLPVYDSGEAAGHLYYVMPYVRGASLRQRIEERGPLPVEQALRIGIEVAEGLAEAHSRGLIHRDIKPENILMSGQHAVLADFGIARAAADGEVGPEGRLTRTGYVLGTSSYMSPEQWSGDPLDGRSDEYSLACVVYEMLTGRPPYVGSGRRLFVAHVAEDVPSVRSERPEVPESVDLALQRAMAKEPGERFETVSEFAEALEGELATRPTTRPWGRWFATADAGGWGRILAILFVLLVGAYQGLAWLSSNGSAGADLARLVVLPFQNLGDPDQAYFTEGITEEITSRLGTISQLGVIGRTSARQYANTDKTIAQIADELDVDYLVEGTVRWGRAAEDQHSLRVSARLIRGRDETQIWQRGYDEVLAGGVFEVQSEIAQRVVDGLGLELGPYERERLATRPTDDPEAYDLYLRGNDYYRRSWARSDVETAIDLYRRATETDPEFAVAFAALGWTHTWMHQLRYDPTPERLRLALTAIDSARTLDPGLPDAEIALGLYYYWGHDDYDRAVEHLREARRMSPSNPHVILNLGNILRRQGEFEEAIRHYRRVTELEPRSATTWFNLGETYLFTRQFDAAETGLDRAISLAPDFADAYVQKMRLLIGRDRDREGARRTLAAAEEEIGPTDWRSSPLALFRIVHDSQELFQRLKPGRYGLDSTSYHSAIASVLTHQGEKQRAVAHWDSARLRLERSLEESDGRHWLYAQLGLAYAGLGRREDALRATNRAVEMLPVSRDALDGPGYLVDRALVYQRLGEPERAIEELERVLGMPSWLSRGMLRLDPIWSPLRGHARFEALLRDEGPAVAVRASRGGR